MRPQISFADLPGRRVGIYGLGTEGKANVRACLALGVEPVLVADTAPQTEDPELDGRAVLAFSSGALLGCDTVIKSPGISRYSAGVRELEAAGVQVVGGLGLWLQDADRSKVVVITGTKGKSTTTAITGHLLERLGYRCLIGGNIGVPPWDPALPSGDVDFWVIEASSYQATDLSCSPAVVAVTSLHPDHLPWHAGDPELYYRDKLSAAAQPGAQLTVANGDSDLIAARQQLLGPRVQWIHADDDPDAHWMDGLGLLGAHNRRNALIARACLVALGVPEASDDELLAAAAQGFAGLDSRLKVVGVINGVTFIDDNLSTNVLPTLAAVDSFPAQRVALIVGGQSRGIEYGSLATGLRARTEKLLMLTVPDNGTAIRAQVEAVGAGDQVEIVDTAGLRAAVRAGYEWVGPGGVVLLSPAAPSFGIFRDYKERGEVFVAAMHEITG
ncbi:UDP-N-acetylmuramoyl-L-alanine--D-glutamate ligase [Nakamurella antarctica]|nr:UDP-N-acetylmuramoyl-L-alanine--D-glutamate ligase [Nakamurella antarctica]